MTQAANLQRVSDNLSDVIIDFCRMRRRRKFHAADLVAFVVNRVPMTAPDSPSRILRELRRQGRVDYEVVSRAASLYRVTKVRP